MTDAEIKRARVEALQAENMALRQWLADEIEKRFEGYPPDDRSQLAESEVCWMLNDFHHNRKARNDRT